MDAEPMRYPPPRMLGMAITPLKCCMKAMRVTLKLGWMPMLNPPYPYIQQGFFPSLTKS